LAENKREELTKEKKLADEELKLLASGLDQLRAQTEAIKNEQGAASQKIKELNQELLQTGSISGGREFGRINSDLKKLFAKLETAELEADLGQVRIILAEIKTDLSLILEAATGTENEGKPQQLQIKLNELTENANSFRSGQ
jgi:hypothetical protein